MARFRMKLPPLLTRAFFREKAKPYEVKIGSLKLGEMIPREMQTGSLGWFFQGKERWKVGDASVAVQINLTVTIIGSKELPKDEQPAPAPLTA